MTTATPATFTIDALHPSRLRCDACGEVVCELPPAAAGPDQAEGLTSHQAALRWPDHAEVVKRHAVVCLWRRHPAPADAWYVHTMERD
jgi:hypothetical protein